MRSPARRPFLVFTAGEGAEDHCQVGSPLLSAQRTFAVPSDGRDRAIAEVSSGTMPGGAAYPVVGWVGVDPSGIRRSKPSGVLSCPGAVPALPVRPYCHTSAPVAGSIAAMRSL